MRKFGQIEVIRAIAVLMVVMYHCWVVCGYQSSGSNIFNNILTYSGEVGVTTFFIISGFGITCSYFFRGKIGDNNSFIQFMKRRFMRIYPQYYASLILMLLLGGGAVYLSLNNMSSVFTHLLFIHNLFTPTHGSISGVLWTIGVIIQFYIISGILYRCIERHSNMTLIASIVFSIVLKCLLYSFFESKGFDGSFYFIYGRQVFTALDNFVIGMFVAYRVLNYSSSKKTPVLVMSLVLLFVWIAFVSNQGNVYSNTLFGYTWHTITALLIGICIWFCIGIEVKVTNPVARIFMFIGKYEYGIYIWHLLIINNLYEKSEIVQKISSRGYWYFAVAMMIVVIPFGWVSSLILEKKK